MQLKKIVFNVTADKCTDLEPLNHGNIDYSNQAGESGIYKRAEFSCDSNYILNGINHNECLKSEKWNRTSLPVCEGKALLRS